MSNTQKVVTAVTIFLIAGGLWWIFSRPAPDTGGAPQIENEQLPTESYPPPRPASPTENVKEASSSDVQTPDGQ